MKCRIMIEDENGLFQAELEKDKSVLDIIGYESENGCHISVRGNAGTVAKQCDALTQFMIKTNPGIIERVVSAWERRIKQ